MVWSKLRQKVRGFITPELRRRLDIHCTCYHDAHDDYGEVWITLDGKKIFGGGYYRWYIKEYSPEILSDFSIIHGFHKDFYNVNIESQTVEQVMKSGIHDTSHITRNLELYLNTSFEDCLKSNNPIYKAFSIIDKRLGKRKFSELVIGENEHPLVKMFYNLRKEVFEKSIQY